MEGFEGLEYGPYNLFAFLGLTHDFFFINLKTILNTWLALIILAAVLLFFRKIFFNNKQGIFHYVLTTGIASFMDLVNQTLGTFIYAYFCLVISLFVFILFCNWIAIIPYASEPTKDLNTALALSLVAFIYKEIEGIRIRGIKAYALEFLEPFSVMLPINLIGHFSKIISMSFRLFGNIFGGSVIMELYQHAIEISIISQLGGMFSGMNIIILLFFGIFEGLIQAFVFAMLTLTYLTIAVYDEHAGEV